MYSSGVTPIGAIYNKKVFAEAGVSDAAEDLERAAGDCDKVKAAGKTCIALGNQTPWITQLIPYAIAPSTAFKDDPNLAQDMLDGKKTFSNSGWRTVFERYLELDKKGDFNKSPNGTTFEQQQALVGSRQGGDGDPGHERRDRHPGRRDRQGRHRDVPVPGRRRRGRPEDPGGRLGGPRRQRATASTSPRPRSSSTGSRSPQNMAIYANANQSIPLVGADERAT